MSSKKGKKQQASSSSSDSDSGPDDHTPPKKKQKADKKKAGDDNEDDNMFELGKLKYVNVREFKGRAMIDIREYYHDKNGDMKPGKKGICLSTEQWKAFKEHVDDVDAALKRF